MAKHDFNPFAGENPFALKGVFKFGERWGAGKDRRKEDRKDSSEKRDRAERKKDRQSANETAKRKSSGEKEVKAPTDTTEGKIDKRDKFRRKHMMKKAFKAMDHAGVEDGTQKTIEDILVKKAPSLEAFDIDRMVEGAKLMDEIKGLSLPTDKKDQLTGFAEDFFKEGRFTSTELVKLEKRIGFFKAANTRLNALDAEVKELVKDADWGNATKADLEQAIHAAEKLEEIEADDSLSDDQKKALKAQMGGDLEDWDQQRLIQQAEQIREARLAIDKTLEADGTIDRILNSTDQAEIIANASVFFRRADGDRARINPKLNKIPYGSYVFDPGNNKLAYKIIKLQNINSKLPGSILVNGERVERTGSEYNEGKKYGQAGYVALERGTMITIAKQPQGTIPENGKSDYERRQDIQEAADKKDLSYAETLKKRDYVKIPKSLRGNKGRETFRTDFDNLENGEFILRQLSILGEVRGMIKADDTYEAEGLKGREKRQARRRARKAPQAATHIVDEMEVWNELRKDFLRIGSTKISYREINKVVFQKAGLDEQEIKDLIGEEGLQKLQLASLRLLDGISHLARVEEAKMDISAPTQFDEYGVETENVLHTWAPKIFKPVNDGRVKHGLFQKATYGKEVSMHTRKPVVAQDMLSYSEKRGYLYLTQGQMKLEDGEYRKTISKADFEERINELYTLGQSQMILSLPEGSPPMKSSISVDDLDNEQIVLAIQKGMEMKFAIEDRLDTELAEAHRKVPRKFYNTAIEGLLLNIAYTNPDATQAELEHIGDEIVGEQRENLVAVLGGPNIGLGTMVNGTQVRQALSIQNKVVQVGGTTIHIAASVSANTINYKQSGGLRPSVGIGTGITQQLGERWEASANVGVDSSGYAGGSTSIKFKFADNLAHSLHLTGMASSDLSEGELVALGVMAGHQRDLGAILNRDTMRTIEDKEEGFEALTRSITEASGLSAAEAELVTPQIRAQLERECGDLTAEEMNRFAYTGVHAGVGFEVNTHSFPQIGILFGVGFGIKGKKRYLMFSPQHPQRHFDEVASAKFAAAMQGEVSWEEFENTLTLNDKSNITYEKSDYVAGGAANFEGMRESFAKSKILLEREGGRIRIDALDVHGEVRIKTAPGSEVETYIENGKVYLNMHEAQGLFIARRDTMYDRPKFGDDHQVTLYIGSQPETHVDWYQGNKTIQYKKSDSGIEGIEGAKHTLGEARIVRSDVSTGLWENENYRSANAMGVDRVERFATTEQLGEAQGKLDSATGARAIEALDSSFEDKVDKAVARIIARREVDYALVVNPAERRNIQSLLEKEMDTKLAGQELAYAVNELVIESRADFPKGKKEAFVKHVMEWNQNSIKMNIIRNNPGMGKDSAAKIAKSVVERYKAEIEANFENPNNATHIGDSPAFSTNIAGNNGETAWMLNSKHENLAVIHPAELTPENLQDQFGLNETEATQFYRSQMAEMFPLPYADPSNPKAFMQSALGMMLMKNAANIFGVQGTEALAKMFRTNTVEDQALWNDFAAAAKALQKGETAVIGATALRITGVQIAFLAKCGNFSRFGGTLEVASTRRGIQADVNEHLNRQKAIKYIGIGVGGMVVVGDKPRTQGPEEVDDEDDPEGNKGQGSGRTPSDRPSPDTGEIPESAPPELPMDQDDPGTGMPPAPGSAVPGFGARPFDPEAGQQPPSGGPPVGGPTN